MTTQEMKYTSAAFLEWANRPENRDRLFELIDGEIIEKVGSFPPSEIAMLIGTYINMYLFEHRIGYVTGADGTYLLSDDFNPMLDVAYISKARMPERPKREVPIAPDLAVEVKSPNDSLRGLRRKAEMYLQFGTKLVWLVLPDAKLVEVYAEGQDVQIINVDGVLDGDIVLPDFKLAVKNIFAA